MASNAASNPGYYNEQQPGIEVAPGRFTDPRYPWGQVEKEAAVHAAHPVTDGANPTTLGRSRRRKKLLGIGVVGAVIVVAVLVGVLAGVLTRRSQNGDGSPSSTGTPATTTTSGPSPSMTGTSTVTARYLFPTAVSLGYPHLEVIALTTNATHSVYRKLRSANATSPADWSPAGASFELVGGAVSAASSSVAIRQRRDPSDWYTDLFVTGSDTALYEKYHGTDNVWSGPGPDTWVPTSPLGNTVLSAPAVVTRGSPYDDLFALARGAHTSIHHMRLTGGVGWGPFEDLGGGDMAFAPAALSWPGGSGSTANAGPRVDVFGVSNTSFHLLHTYAEDGASWATFNGGATTFQDLGGFVTSTPAVVARATGVLDVFARGGDAGLWHLGFANGSWGAWERISDGKTTIQGQPNALSWDEDRIDVFAWGSDGALLTKSWDAKARTWSPSQEGFDQIGSGLSGPPNSVSDAPGSMHVFAYGLYGSVVWKHWNASDGGKWPTGDFVNLGTPDF